MGHYSKITVPGGTQVQLESVSPEACGKRLVDEDFQLVSERASAMKPDEIGQQAPVGRPDETCGLIGGDFRVPMPHGRPLTSRSGTQGHGSASSVMTAVTAAIVNSAMVTHSIVITAIVTISVLAVALVLR